MNTQFIHLQNVRNIARSTEGVAMAIFEPMEGGFGTNTVHYPGSLGDKVTYCRRGNAFGVPGKWDRSCNCCDLNPNR